MSSRGFAVVVIQGAAEPPSANNLALYSSRIFVAHDQLTLEPLVRAFFVIVNSILANRPSKMPLPKREHLMKAFRFDRPHKSFSVSVQIRAFCRQLQGFHAAIPQNPTESLSKERIAIMEQILLTTKKSISMKGQVPGDLRHPNVVGLSRDPSDLDTPGRELHHEKNMEANQAYKGQDLDGEEVHGSEGLKMTRKKSLPISVLLALGGRLDPVVLEDPFYRVPCDRDPEQA